MTEWRPLFRSEPFLVFVLKKEYCEAKKSENRFRIAKGTKFYRVLCCRPEDGERRLRELRWVQSETRDCSHVSESCDPQNRKLKRNYLSTSQLSDTKQVQIVKP